MQKRCTVIILALASILSASAVVGAQTNENQRPDATGLFPIASRAARPSFTPDTVDMSIAQQPAGPPATPRHTGIKALTTHLVTNFKYLPSKENLLWAGAGGGLALAAHPFDDNVNEALVGNDTAENIFKPGEILGELGTLLGSASVVYAVGRLKDQPKVSHLGMDLIEALAMSEALTQTLKYTTRRERPDGSSKNSFPSGHAADTFAFATALERHVNWKYSVPAYLFASYVAMSRLPANRHWLSDAVFGSAVGIIAGRTVTSHEAERPFPVAVIAVPGGMAIMYARQVR
jgi:membrane-associated phospholipid phosphatase